VDVTATLNSQKNKMCVESVMCLRVMCIRMPVHQRVVVFGCLG
jgi:hypothetical protein